jgi:hypothetical protein
LLVELPGSAYLYALAMVSITFVGFSALLIVMRQARGRRPTSYDTYFTLSFIQVGFIVTASGLVPPALALYDWPAGVVWRVSSAIVAIPILLFVSRVPARRRAATGTGVPAFVTVLLWVQAATATALLLNAAVGLPRPGAIYDSAVTVVLFSSGVAYLFALTVILPEFGESEGDASVDATDRRPP